MNSFKDIVEPEDHNLIGSKVDVKDVLGKELVVCSFVIRPSKFEGKGDCMYLQVQIDGEYHVIFTGGTVLMDQAQKYKDKMPFTATIMREGSSNRKYYTFT